MTIDPHLIKEIENIVESKIEEKVKTIQIEYLKENFLTRDEFLDAMERIDNRFNAMQKQMDDRFNAMQKQMDDRFNAMQKQIDDRFNAMQKQMDDRFERVYERFDTIDIGYSDVVEGMGYSIVKREFKNRGLNVDLQIRQHFTDKEHFVHPDTEDVEIDIFHINPNIIGEATLKITELDKIRTFIKKIQFLEKTYNMEFQRFFICFKIAEKIKEDVLTLLKKYAIELIVPQHE
ncbi:MAG: hypothetical protein ACTSYC_11440 [Promethearchaeota archaeon]